MFSFHFVPIIIVSIMACISIFVKIFRTLFTQAFWNNKKRTGENSRDFVDSTSEMKEKIRCSKRLRSIFISSLKSHPRGQSWWFGCLTADMSLAPIKSIFAITHLKPWIEHLRTVSALVKCQIVHFAKISPFLQKFT